MGMLETLLQSLKGVKLTPDEEMQVLEAVGLAEGGTTMADTDLAKVYEEHNTDKPHADVKDQCQCAKCNEYRKGK